MLVITILSGSPCVAKKNTKTFTFECKHGGREVGHPKRKQQELTVGVIEGTTILCNKERRCT